MLDPKQIAMTEKVHPSEEVIKSEEGNSKEEKLNEVITDSHTEAILLKSKRA